MITGEGPATSKLRRIPALEIETAVRDAFFDLLMSTNQILDAFGERAGTGTEEIKCVLQYAAMKQDDLRSRTIRDTLSAVRACLAGVIVGSDRLQLEINQVAFHHWLTNEPTDPGTGADAGNAVFSYAVNARIRMRGAQMKLVLDDTNQAGSGTPEQAPVGLIVLAHELRQQLLSGTTTSIQKIAYRHDLTVSYVGRMLRMGFLAPDIRAAILEGTHPPELTAETLRRLERLPVDWVDQRRILGFPPL